jgi:hypothetical protein
MARISFNIVAICATGLNGCDCSAEVEMRLAVGEGKCPINLPMALSEPPAARFARLSRMMSHRSSTKVRVTFGPRAMSDLCP